MPSRVLGMKERGGSVWKGHVRRGKGHVRGGIDIEVFGFGDSLRFDLAFLEEEETFWFDAMIN